MKVNWRYESEREHEALRALDGRAILKSVRLCDVNGLGMPKALAVKLGSRYCRVFTVPPRARDDYSSSGHAARRGELLTARTRIDSEAASWLYAAGMCALEAACFDEREFTRSSVVEGALGTRLVDNTHAYAPLLRVCANRMFAREYGVVAKTRGVGGYSVFQSAEHLHRTCREIEDRIVRSALRYRHEYFRCEPLDNSSWRQCLHADREQARAHAQAVRSDDDDDDNANEYDKDDAMAGSPCYSAVCDVEFTLLYSKSSQNARES